MLKFIFCLTCAPGGECKDILRNAQPKTVLRGYHHLVHYYYYRHFFIICHPDLVDRGRPEPSEPHSPIHNINLDCKADNN